MGIKQTRVWPPLAAIAAGIVAFVSIASLAAGITMLAIARKPKTPSPPPAVAETVAELPAIEAIEPVTEPEREREFGLPGDDVYIDRTMIGRTVFDLERAVQLLAARDDIGFQELSDSGRITLIEKRGFPRTPARVIDKREHVSEIRLMSGVNHGKSGWILNIHIHPFTPSPPEESPSGE